MMSLPLLSLLTLNPAHADPCSTPVPLASIDATIQRVDDAALASQNDQIPALAAQLRDALPCVDEVLDEHEVGGIHRVMALDAFIDRRRDEAKAEFAALRAADPSYVLPLDPFVEGHPVRADFVAIQLTDPVTTPLPAPASGRLFVNGKVAERRPDAWPVVIQWERTRGHVGLTALVKPGDPPPEYPVAKQVADGGRHPHKGHPADGQDGAKHEGPRWVLVGAGGAALVASGGLGLWSSAEAATWRDCLGADVAGCQSANQAAAWKAWKGDTAWEDLRPVQQSAESLRYGANEAAEKSRTAGTLALGAAVLGAGLITVGFVW